MVLTKEGKLDGISCPSSQREREVWLAFTNNPFFPVELGLFARKDSQINIKDSQVIKGKDERIKQIKAVNLKGKHIGILANSFAAKIVAKCAKGQLILKKYFDESDRIKMLHVKRFGLAYLSRVTGEKLLSDRYPQISKDIEYLGTVNKAFIHPGISLKYFKAKQIAKKLDAGYQIIKGNGELEKNYRQNTILGATVSCPYKDKVNITVMTFPEIAKVIKLYHHFANCKKIIVYIYKFNRLARA